MNAAEPGKSDASNPRPLRVWLPTIRAGSGSDVFVDRLASGLERIGYDPIVQWFDQRYEFSPWLLHTAKAPPKTDIIQANSWHAFAFRRPGIPLIATEHHYIQDPAFRPYRTKAQTLYHWLLIERFVQRSYKAADSIVAVSEHTAKAIRCRTGLKADVIHNWVDTEQFTPASTINGPSEPNRPFRLLFVGNPSVRKGSELLPEIAGRLGKTFEIRCLGGLRKGHSFNPLPGNLIPLPSVPQHAMPTIYRDVDAVLVLSRYEAFGYVALEGMSSGLPVVGFNSTGIAEVCKQEETALLTPVNSIDDLVEQCKRLRDNPDFCRRLGEAGRKRSVRLFSGDRSIDAYLNIYSTCARYKQMENL